MLEMICDMTPSSKVNNMINAAFGHVIVASYLGDLHVLMDVLFANLNNLTRGQFGVATKFADLFSSFSDTIRIVFRKCSQEEMIGAHAISHVALMSHTESFRDKAIVKRPRKTVNTTVSPLMALSNPKTPVSVTIYLGGPNPAGIGFSNVFPKLLFPLRDGRIYNSVLLHYLSALVSRLQRPEGASFLPHAITVRK